MAKTWIYPACTLVGVYDGDTITVDIDLGQDLWIKRRSVRLVGIAARELREEGGAAARDHLAELLARVPLLRVTSYGWDKYAGRIDGLVYRGGETESVNTIMVRDGCALPWDGRGRQPVPVWPIERREVANVRPEEWRA